MSAPAEDDLSALKGRRKGGSRRRAGTPAPTLPPDVPEPPDDHPTMAEALARPSGLVALDPLYRRQPTVVEIGGYVPPARLERDYVVSRFDANEQILPRGCRTPVSRVLWRVGQHVRRDVMNTYLRDHPELAEQQNPPVEVKADEIAPEDVQQPEDSEPPVNPQAEGGAPAQVAEPTV